MLKTMDMITTKAADLSIIDTARANHGVELSVIVPTFNESGNVAELVHRLETALAGIRWEVIFVDDDSPDGTADEVRSLAQMKSTVRCIHRIGRRGLSRAVIEGMLASSAPYLAVMDADLQHDESILPRMIETLRERSLDVVVGSRYCMGGGIGAWDAKRAAMSRFATNLSRMIVKADLSDPMSGYFVIRREVLDCVVRRLSGEGYKILLDVFASSPVPLKFAEVPYTFRERKHGESKLDSAVVWEYLMLIVDKKIGHIVPARFALFSLVGLSGVLVHFAVLSALFKVAVLSFVVSQTAATFVAMTTNFFLNNFLTYRDRRLRGIRLFGGLLSFYLICSIGVIGNVGVARFVFEHEHGWILAGLAGVVVGVVWNYVASAMFTWRTSK
jgi:dolichol-phosphate mannosyltransferase